MKIQSTFKVQKSVPTITVVFTSMRQPPLLSGHCHPRLSPDSLFVLSSTYITARVYVNCADEFHTLRRMVVRRVYTIFLRAWSKKCVTQVPLLFSATRFLCITLLCETKNF